MPLERLALGRKVGPEVRAAALRARQRRLGDEPREEMRCGPEPLEPTAPQPAAADSPSTATSTPGIHFMKTIINTTENRCQLRQARTRLDGVQNTAAELFRDPTLRWRPVSPRLATERRIPAAVAAAAGLLLIPIGLMVATEPFDVIAPLIGLCLIVGAAIGWVTVTP